MARLFVVAFYEEGLCAAVNVIDDEPEEIKYPSTKVFTSKEKASRNNKT